MGFLHNADLIERGYLIDEDFPSWFPEEARYLVKSRYQLFSAHERKIKKCGNSELFDDDDDIQYTTIAPVHTFKSSFQSSYNCGKWSLVKNTEFALNLPPSKVCMETKYVFRCLPGPLVNLWRVEQSIDHVVPFIISHRIENSGENPSMEQIKNILDKLPWEKFI